MRNTPRHLIPESIIGASRILKNALQLLIALYLLLGAGAGKHGLENVTAVLPGELLAGGRAADLWTVFGRVLHPVRTVVVLCWRIVLLGQLQTGDKFR